MYDSTAQPHLENPDHIVICMECRKNVTKESIKNSNYNYNIDEATTPPLAEEHNCEKEESNDEYKEESNDEYKEESNDKYKEESNDEYKEAIYEKEEAEKGKVKTF